MSSLLAGAVGKVFNIETGLVHTVLSLSRRPHDVIRGYWSGATARYTHPAIYLLIGFAIFSVSGKLFGRFTGGGDVERIAALAFIPFVAAASRLFFARSRYNYAEHLILVMYVLGHIALLFAALMIVFPLFERTTTWIIAAIALGGGAIYNAWVYVRVFQRHAVLDAVAGLAALLAGALAWSLILLVFIVIIRS